MKKRFLALFIALAMLISNITVFAIDTNQSSILNETAVTSDVTNFNSIIDENLNELVVLEEIVELRDESVKHFSLSNGINKAVVYSQPVHYMDDNGNWVDINNSLTLNGNEYSTKNKHEIKFANKSGSSGLLSIKDGGYKIDFTPLNTNKVNVTIENPQENNSRKFDDMKSLRNLISKATYSNIFNGVDIEYILSGNNIKENIIVNGKQDSYEYSFELKLSKLNAELQNGSIVLSDSDTGEAIYVIPAPYMYDANGTISTDVEYSLVQKNTWKYTVTVTASTNWINANERAFPVTIDPTIVTNVDDDTFVMSDNADNSTLNYMVVGNFIDNDIPAFMKFNDIPSLPTGSVLYQAKTAMIVSYIDNPYNLDFYVGVYKATDDWINDENFTYSTSDQYRESEPEHSVKLSGVGTYEWDITSLYEQWLSGAENYGVCIKAVNLPLNQYARAHIPTTEQSSTFVPPQIEISYVYARGVEDYYGMLSTPLGEYGNSYVNLYNGSLTYINKLTSIENQNFTYDINMVYSSLDLYWTLNEERLEFFEDENGDTPSNICRYLWRDPDGTIHCFTPYLQKNSWGDYVQYEFLVSAGMFNQNNMVEYVPEDNIWQTSNPTIFYSEDNIDYVLIKTSTNEFILRDFQGNQRFFDCMGNLTKICNSSGDMLYFYYIKQHNERGQLPRLSSIAYKPNNGTTLVEQVRFDYDTQNNLRYVYNIQTRLEVSIDWQTTWRIRTIKYNSLNQDVYNTIDFIYYGAARLLGKITDSSSEEMLFLTKDNNDGRYLSLQKSTQNSTEGAFSIEYQENQTVLTETIANDNSTISTYTFDEKGRKTTITNGNDADTFTYDESLFPGKEYYLIAYHNNIYNEPYSSAEAAAMAFAQAYYSLSRYILHEYGAYIYSCAYNGNTTYNYTNIVFGGPHNVTLYISGGDTREIVANVHTHSQLADFSDDDIIGNESRGIDGYLAAPGNLLKKYSVANNSTTDGIPFSSIVLTELWKGVLVNRFRTSWNNHTNSTCNYGFDCHLKDESFWPNQN